MVVKQVSSGSDKVVIESEFLNTPPAVLFDYWIKPELITRWWPAEAEIDPRPGGAYHLSWPKMNWHLRGHYTIFDPGKQLAFTWKWDHEPDTTQVVVDFEALSDTGTKLTITHGSYSDSAEDQETRAGHIEGWNYFISKLLELRQR